VVGGEERRGVRDALRSRRRHFGGAFFSKRMHVEGVSFRGWRWQHAEDDEASVERVRLFAHTHRLVQLAQPRLEPDLGRLGHQVQPLLHFEHQLVESGVERGGVLELQGAGSELRGRAVLGRRRRH
jgi:hypothetical protein